MATRRRNTTPVVPPAGKTARRRERALRPGIVLIVLFAGLLWGCSTGNDHEQNPNQARGAVPPSAELVEGTGELERRRTHDGNCAAVRFQGLIGREMGEVDAAALPGPLRVYPDGSRITGDHRPERMNIVLGRDGRIVKVKCG